MQTERLHAVTVKLYDEESPLAKIWHDVFEKEISMRNAMSKKTGRPAIPTTTVFAASFKDPGGSVIIMAAMATPEKDCTSYTNIGLSPVLMSCPLRVALVKNDADIKVVYSNDSFPFVMEVNEEGEFKDESKANNTQVFFNYANKTLTTKLVENGIAQKDTRDNTVILLKY